MESWNHLVRIASLGTARAGEELSLVDYLDTQEELREILEGEQGDEPAKRLLRNAAVLTLLRRAGSPSRPATSSEIGRLTHLTEGTPGIDSRPVCSLAAARRLVSILTTRRHLLTEWLELLDVSACRIPEGMIPEMLELGLVQPESQGILRRLIGQRGAWLAEGDPRWSWVKSHPVGSVTRSHSPELNGSPDTPGSRLETGAQELVLSLLSLRSQPFERTTIEVRAPAAHELELLHQYASRCDELEEPGSERSIHLDSPLARLLARLDPTLLLNAWEEVLPHPELILRAAARSVEREMLLAALTEASAHWRAIDWIDLLIAERLSEPTEEGLEVFRLLPAERQEHWILQALRQSRNLEVDQPGFWLLTRSSTVWSERIASRLWPLMRVELESRTTTVNWDWRLLTSLAGCRLDPLLAGEAAAFFADSATESSPLRPDLERMLDDLSFRAAMAGELRQQS